MAKTKNPSGLSVARTTNKLSCTWKIGDSDYGDGQQFQWKIDKGKWTKKSVGKTATATPITLTLANYYPYAKKPKIKSFWFRVRGNRKKYTKKNKKINPGWSGWTKKEFKLAKPPKPALTATLSDSQTNVTTFSWTVTESSSTSNGGIFSRVEWQTALVKNCAIKPEKVKYGSSHYSTSLTGSTVQTEDTSQLADGNSYTRFVRVRSQGPYGSDDTDWVYAKHVYAAANASQNVKVESVRPTNQGGLEVVVTWDTSQTDARPIDDIIVQYIITDNPDAGLECPSGASWTDATNAAYKDGSDMARFTLADPLSDDEVLFIRVNTKHDTVTTPGSPVLAYVGSLTDPSGLSVQTDDTTFRATVTATNNSNISDSFLAVVYTTASAPDQAYVAGIIPHGQTGTLTNIQCADWTDETAKAFGVYAVVGEYAQQTRDDGITSYVVTPFDGKPLMISDTKWDGGAVPSAPAVFNVNPTTISGTVRATWSWSWEDATGIELSWADHDDAWESTDEPETYDVSNMHAAQWNISSLATGVTWYMRARFYRDVNDERTYGPYSVIRKIDLSSAPSIPTLVLEPSVIPTGGTVTASWAYSTGDGSAQAYAEIREATYTTNGITYGDVVAHTETAQHVTIDAETAGWSTGETHNLCVMVVSASGRASDAWSDPVPVTIAEPPTCTISQTSLTNAAVVEDSENETTRTVLSLTEMPLTITVTGAGDAGTTTVAVERAADYPLDRPDGNRYTGFEGETTALYSQTGEAQIEISLDNPDVLLGHFDDGAQYRIVATVTDTYGQSAETELPFEVHWSDQALMPDVDIVTDMDNYVTRITPIAPANVRASDRVDIYRLSADMPELIYQGAEFGTTYIDPYPAIGEFGGHRIVFKTENGDFITADEHFAWVDTDGDDDDLISLYATIIDFNGEQIILPYNISVSGKWKKDFEETVYLGGSVQGDWNPGISRTASVSTVAVSYEDQTTIQAMRRLAAYPGICQVRTPDGSSYAADVQVSEDQGYDTAGKVVEYKLSITRVDPEGLDGLTLLEWLTDAQAAYLYAINSSGHLVETSESGVRGGRTFAINSAYHLIMTKSDSAVEDIEFALEDGRLVVTYVS